MKRVLVLLGAVLVSGCFICNKSAPQAIPPQEVAPTEQPSVAPKVVTPDSVDELARFAFDSEEPNINTEKLDQLDQTVKSYPNAVILVEGYTDNVGEDGYNESLALRRANAIADVLRKRGYPNSIRIYGRGASSFVAPNDTEEGRAQNRRVNVVLVEWEQSDQ